MPPYRLLLRLAFWAALAFALVMALIPQPPPLPGQPSDKLLHILAFLVLTGLALAAYPRLALWHVGLGLILFGAGIEIAQMTPGLNRDPSIADWLADAAAVAFILLAAKLLRLR